MNTASQYDRFTAHIEAERDQIAADYEALAAQHAAEIEQLREAARAYRSVLYGADGRGLLGESERAEIENVEDRYADLIDQ